jgi:hypothetical protein
MSAVFLLPVPVEEEDQIEPLMQLPAHRPSIMVDMDHEPATAPCRMQAAGIECWIGENPANAREAFDELEERPGIEQMHKMTRQRTESIFSGQAQLFDTAVI